MSNDVVRQFAIDIERQRAEIVSLKRSNVGLGIGLGLSLIIGAFTAVELYLFEEKTNNE